MPYPSKGRFTAVYSGALKKIGHDLETIEKKLWNFYVRLAI